MFGNLLIKEHNRMNWLYKKKWNRIEYSVLKMEYPKSKPIGNEWRGSWSYMKRCKILNVQYETFLFSTWCISSSILGVNKSQMEMK